MQHVATILLLAFLLAPATPQALTLHRNVPTASRDIEFFYQHKKTESLVGILRSLDAHRRFEQSELRLTTAAFLAEILKKDPSQGPELFALAEQLSPSAQRVLFWTAHLTGNVAWTRACAPFEASLPTHFKEHVAAHPRNLLRWNLLESRAVVLMYWGAFFADADTRYLDAMLDAVSLFAELDAHGTISDPRYQNARFVAAELFEMTPRHPIVRRHLEAKKKRVHGAEAAVLATILSAKAQ